MTDFDQTKKEQLALEVNREIKSRQVIDNSEFKQFFEEYRAELVDNLIRTKGDEVDKREELGAAAGLPVSTAGVAIIQEGDAKTLIKEIIDLLKA